MNLRKNLILLAAALLTLWVIFTPLNRIGRLRLHYYDTPPQPNEVLTAHEVDNFLALWSEFLQTSMSRNLPQMSLSSGVPSQILSGTALRWFAGHGWNVDRFFYVEQRLRAAVKTAQLMQHLEANRKLSHTINDQNYRNMEQIISEQERKINAEKLTVDELALVSGNLYQINAILDGKLIYQPD